MTEEISDIFTPEGIQKLKTGQVLIFDFEGERIEKRITKINRKSGQVWAKDVKTFDENDLGQMVKDNPEAFNTEEPEGL